MSLIRTRWAALGAAVAITLGAGGIGLVNATSPADATTFIAITPCRVMDTRPEPAFNVGPRSTPVGPDENHAVTAIGNSGDCTAVPANAAAVSLNVTALNATRPTFLTIYASNVTRPGASSLNPEPGGPPTPNAVTTELSPGGQFTVFNRFGSVDMIADINGYYVDHHHDDRYYRKADVDAAIAAVGDRPTMYAHVTRDASGGFVVDPTRTFGVVDVVLPGTGNTDRPCVVVPTSVDRDTVVAITTVDANGTPQDEFASVHHRVGREGSQGCPVGSIALYIRRHGGTESTSTVAFNVYIP